MFPSEHRERYLFNNYIETDGVGVSLTFRRPIATIRGGKYTAYYNFILMLYQNVYIPLFFLTLIVYNFRAIATVL